VLLSRSSEDGPAPGTYRATLTGRDGQYVESVAFSPDGKTLATGSLTTRCGCGRPADPAAARRAPAAFRRGPPD